VNAQIAVVLIDPGPGALPFLGQNCPTSARPWGGCPATRTTSSCTESLGATGCDSRSPMGVPSNRTERTDPLNGTKPGRTTWGLDQCTEGGGRITCKANAAAASPAIVKRRRQFAAAACLVEASTHCHAPGIAISERPSHRVGHDVRDARGPPAHDDVLQRFDGDGRQSNPGERAIPSQARNATAQPTARTARC